jgi:hypothetical protein
LGRDLRPRLATAIDGIALLGIAAFVAIHVVWPVIDLVWMFCGGPYVRFSIFPMIALYLAGIPWLARRHGARIASFYLLAMAGDAEVATLSRRMARLFAALDAASCFAATLLLCTVAWLVLGSGLSTIALPAEPKVPVQLLIFEAILFPALIGMGWLVLRTRWGQRLYPRGYRTTLENIAQRGDPKPH